MKDKTWKKLDKRIFKFYAGITKFLVKKHKHRYHKHNVYKWFLYGKIPFIFLYFVGETLDVANNKGSFTVGAIVVGVLLLVWFFQYWSNEAISQIYDLVFMLRKNPTIYKGHKAFCKNQFEKNIDRRKKRFIGNLIITGGVACLDIFYFLAYGYYSALGLGLYFIYALFIESFELYLNTIFDFEPPKKKKKKEKARMTDMAKNFFDNLLKRPVVQPNLT